MRTMKKTRECKVLDAIRSVRDVRRVFATILLQGLLWCSGWAADQVPTDRANEESLFDKDLNKRSYMETGGAAGADFRSVAPAMAVSATYKF